MTSNDALIYCTATEEPFAPEGKRRVHVSLAFETRADEATAREQVGRFVRALPTARFLLCAVAQVDGKWTVASATGGEPLVETFQATPAIDPKAILDWTGKRLDADGGSWSGRQEGHDEALSHRRPTAGALLGAARAWDAPLAGMAGLSRLFELEADTLPAEWVVVPVFADAVVIAAEAERPETELDLTFAANLGGTIGIVDVHARHEGLGTLAPPLGDDGFFRLGEDYLPLLRRLRSYGAAAFAAAPALIGIPWPKRDDAGHGRLRWRGVNALLTMVDPLIGALTMADPEREGPFVKILNDVLDEAGVAADPRAVIDWVTERITLTFLAPQPADAAERTRLFNVGQVLGLVGGSTAAPVTLDPASLAASLLCQAIGAPLVLTPDLLSQDPDAQLDAELARLLVALEGERTGEEIIVRLLKVADITDARGVEANVWPAATAPVARLIERLAGEYNGADAVRQATGSVIEHAFVAAMKVPPATPDPQQLAAAVRDADWFATRLGLADARPLARWRAALVPAFGWPASTDDTPEGAWPGLPAWLAQRHAAAAEDLLSAAAVREMLGTAGDVRDVPETVPPPITIRFGMDHDRAAGDRFDDLFQGVGMLVRRLEPHGRSWAHANLATLEEEASGAPLVPVALHSLRPASEDGQRRLGIDYHGFPLATTKLEADASGDGASRSRAFYRFDDPALGTLGAFTPLPALYYGARYGIAAFAVASSGALPPRLVADADAAGIALPWLPKADIGSADLPGQKRVTCSRQTAIGQAALMKPGVAGARSALDAAIDEVQPLFRDFPRLAVAAPRGGRTWLDLGRGRDGAGLLQAGDTVALEELLRWGGGTADFAVFATARTDPAAPRMPITNRQEPIAIPDGGDPDARYWVRITLAASETEAAGLSFADPMLLGAGDRPGFILLRPSDADHARPFRPELAAAAGMQVTFPQMSFLDFDRWLSNPHLMAEASGNADAAVLDMVHKTLMEAFAKGILVRPAADKDPALTIEALNMLPDLAITALQIVLTPVDTLAGTTGKTATAIARELPVPKLGEVLKGVKGSWNILKAIRDAYRVDLVVTSGGELDLSFDDDGIRAVVPPGTVARLSIRPLVPAKMFDTSPAVIAAGIADWAVGEDGGRRVFDGPAVVVETMEQVRLPADWAGDAQVPVRIRPAGRERRYRIVAQGRVSDAHRGMWRGFGSVEIESQRWRFLGRPFRDWSWKPKAAAKTGDWQPGFPAVPVVASAALAAFEEQLFGERSESDAHTRTVMLHPQPGETVLADMIWERPSATWFRHRLTLRSRYWGALALPRNDGAVPLQAAKDWWGRVAMLADRARIDLTRPQLRALLPLTVATDGGAGTPPILALLSEPPFAQGGLADRIAAEIRTGFSHEIAPADPAAAGAAPTLRILDSRKEAGPDPRLSYAAMAEDDARSLLLDTEGPIGLGDDRVVAAASATYPNSAHVLTPVARMPLAEHFLAVSMRRYLHPDWVVDPVAEETSDAPGWAADTARWIEFALPAETGEAQATLSCGALVVARIRRTATEAFVEVGRDAILPPTGGSGGAVAPVVVAGVQNLGHDARFALLHQPLDGARGALSVFRIGQRGPVMLAGYEWSAGTPPPPRTPRLTWMASSGTAPDTQPVSASTATALQWTRTGANADLLHLVDESGGVEPRMIRDELAAIRSSSGVTLRVAGAPRWAVSPLACRPEPLHVQRHLATIATRDLPGEGGEEFAGVRLALARLLPIDPAADRLRFLEFELIAQPLCSGVAGVPPRYASARFDLAAIGRETRCDLLFFVRPLGGWRVGVPGRPRKLSLTMAGQSMTIDLGEGSVASILLLVPWDGRVRALKIDARGVATSLEPIDGSGKPIDCSDGRIGDEVRSPVIAWTQLQVGRDGAETWADIAMLTVPAGSTGDFVRGLVPLPLERFFSAEAEPATNPAGAVAAAALKQLPEAEMRLISVSERMAIAAG
jgi:hypothetical protein